MIYIISLSLFSFSARLHFVIEATRYEDTSRGNCVWLLLFDNGSPSEFGSTKDTFRWAENEIYSQAHTAFQVGQNHTRSLHRAINKFSFNCHSWVSKIISCRLLKITRSTAKVETLVLYRKIIGSRVLSAPMFSMQIINIPSVALLYARL